MTVVEDIYSNNLTTQDEASQIVDDVVENIIGGSNVLDIVINVANNTDNISWVVLEGDDIVTELATISSITSNEDIVDVNTTTKSLVDTYLPQIFEAIDIFIDVSTENYNNNNTNRTNITDSNVAEEQKYVLQDQLYVIAEQSQELIENLESTLQTTLASVDNTTIDEANNNNNNEQVVDSLNSLAQSLVDYATLAASKALSQSDVGETFNYEKTEYNDNGTIASQKIITCTKFEANIFDNNIIDEKDIILPKIGGNKQNIQLPLTFMKEQDGTFDCAFMSNTRNNFNAKNDINKGRKQESNVISVNIYGENKQLKYKRRRLQNVIEYESNQCFPYLISMEIDNDKYDLNNILSLNKEYPFPSCDFWNINESFWDTNGCYVHNIINNTIICGCTHLTTFTISSDNIIPEANTLTELDWRQLTVNNLLLYPTVWVTILIIFIIFAIICYINPRSSRVSTKTIRAYQDIIYKSAFEDRLWIDVAGKEITCISDYMPNQDAVGYGMKKIAPTREARNHYVYYHIIYGKNI